MVTVTKISGMVYMLTDRFGCGACLVVGSQRALLYDTGCGVDDVAGEVRKLTDLPVTVILSHGHFDHIGGSRFFDRVYMSDKDRSILEEYDEELLNKWITELENGGKYPEILKGVPEDKGEPRESTRRILFGCDGWKKIAPLEDKCISLGDIRGEIIEIPGHSQGSVGVLFPQLRLLLGSDALEPVMCLMFKNHGDRHQQLQTLKDLSELDFDNYLTSHSDKLFSKEYIFRMIRCIERCEGKIFHEYQYPRPPYSDGYFYVDSLEDEPVGIILSVEEFKSGQDATGRRLGEKR